jgi:hypothetical protein
MIWLGADPQIGELYAKKGENDALCGNKKRNKKM